MRRLKSEEETAEEQTEAPEEEENEGEEEEGTGGHEKSSKRTSGSKSHDSPEKSVSRPRKDSKKSIVSADAGDQRTGLSTGKEDAAGSSGKRHARSSITSKESKHAKGEGHEETEAEATEHPEEETEGQQPEENEETVAMTTKGSAVKETSRGNRKGSGKRSSRDTQEGTTKVSGEDTAGETGSKQGSEGSTKDSAAATEAPASGEQTAAAESGENEEGTGKGSRKTRTRSTHFERSFRQLIGQPAVRKLRAEENLRNRSQQPGEKLINYIEDVLNLCKRVNASLTKSEKIRHILKGYQPTLDHGARPTTTQYASIVATLVMWDASVAIAHGFLELNNLRHHRPLKFPSSRRLVNHVRPLRTASAANGRRSPSPRNHESGQGSTEYPESASGAGKVTPDEKAIDTPPPISLDLPEKQVPPAAEPPKRSFFNFFRRKPAAETAAAAPLESAKPMDDAPVVPADATKATAEAPLPPQRIGLRLPFFRKPASGASTPSKPPPSQQPPSAPPATEPKPSFFSRYFASGGKPTPAPVPPPGKPLPPVVALPVSAANPAPTSAWQKDAAASIVKPGEEPELDIPEDLGSTPTLRAAPLEKKTDSDAAQSDAR
ncbi:uncharacterized protein LOC142586081 [Dermacentor variabilis]|uniref:uncharacterized protein LOC142586081 n=1 Tax=Dermacentor variabilis TaxID=34621 RepID=UPI003F5B8C17